MALIFALPLPRAARAAFILAVWSGVAWAQAPAGPALGAAAQSGTPTAPSSAKGTIKPGAKPVIVPTVAKPLWTELTPAQQQALAPLSTEWDKLGATRKKKWLEISSKFATMTPDHQARSQERMREWAKLTPEQRRTARESFSRAKKLNPDDKSTHWQNYQQLPEEQKKKLAAEAKIRQGVANLPPPSQAKGSVTPPKKPPQKQTVKAVPPKTIPAVPPVDSAVTPTPVLSTK